MGRSFMDNDQQVNEKQKAFFDRARKGVLKFVQDSGGQVEMNKMHDYSLNKFLIQHQAFSKMMETLVDEGLVDFDPVTFVVTITDTGKNFIAE